jgi:hypothetical protein
LLVSSCGGSSTASSEEDVCFEVIIWTDGDQPTDAEGWKEWVAEGGDLIIASRQYARASGKPTYARLADNLEGTVEAIEKTQDPTVVNFMVPVIGPTMDTYFALCEPYIDKYLYGDGGP